jgi:hypothetical protein
MGIASAAIGVTSKRFLESWKLWNRKLVFVSTAYEVVALRLPADFGISKETEGRKWSSGTDAEFSLSGGFHALYGAHYEESKKAKTVAITHFSYGYAAGCSGKCIIVKIK